MLADLMNTIDFSFRNIRLDETFKLIKMNTKKYDVVAVFKNILKEREDASIQIKFTIPKRYANTKDSSELITSVENICRNINISSENYKFNEVSVRETVISGGFYNKEDHTQVEVKTSKEYLI